VAILVLVHDIVHVCSAKINFPWPMHATVVRLYCIPTVVYDCTDGVLRLYKSVNDACAGGVDVGGAGAGLGVCNCYYLNPERQQGA